MYQLVTIQTALAGNVAGKAAMYYVLPAYDSFAIICMMLARIPDANDLLVPGRSSSLKALVWMQECATLNSNTVGTAVITMTRLLLFYTE